MLHLFMFKEGAKPGVIKSRDLAIQLSYEIVKKGL